MITAYKTFIIAAQCEKIWAAIANFGVYGLGKQILCLPKISRLY
jgi:hypothetical protein